MKSRKLIGNLFNGRKSFSAFPVKVLYEIGAENPNALQAGVTVSSRNFKKAVQRNRVKRLLREAFRLQRKLVQNTLTVQNKSLVLFFIYTGKELPTFAEVSASMETLLRRLVNELSKP